MNSFGEWLESAKVGLKAFAIGLLRLLLIPVSGIASAAVWLGRKVDAFVRREPVASCIVALVVLLLSLGWFTTFASERSRAKIAEHQRDSLSLELSRITETYEYAHGGQ